MADPKHADGSVVDIVDREPKRNLHGVTWHVHADAMLDEISRLHTIRDQAREAILQLGQAHPDIVSDEHFALACLALR